MRPSELRLHRKSTKAFIDADSVEVVLVPHEKGRTSGGGTALIARDARAAQKMRLIPVTDLQPSVQTPDGVQITPTFILMGEWDCEMARWDTFSLNGGEYQITSTVRPEHSTDSIYFKKADVARS